MNNESFLIDELDLDIARDICKFIDDSQLRNRAAANITAANLATKYFQDIEIDTKSGLHNICQVLEDTEISDIYINNNYIDVRLYFEDNGLFVPKSHFDNELLPIAYMFIKVNEELSNGLVTGFVVPTAVDKTINYNGYYKIEEDALVSYYDVESNFINKFEEDISNDFEIKIHEYLDGRLKDKQAFYKILINSREARLKLISASKVKTLFDFVSIPKIETEVNDIAQNEEVILDLTNNEEFATLEEAEISEFDNIVETFTLEEDSTQDMSEIDLSENNEELTESEDLQEQLLDEEEFSLQDNVEMLEPDNSIQIDEAIDFESFSHEELANEDTEKIVNSDNHDDENEEEEEEEEEKNNDDINILDTETLSFEEDNGLDIIPEQLDSSTQEQESFAQELDILDNTETETTNTEEPTEFKYSTNTTPSIDSFDSDLDEEDNAQYSQLEQTLDKTNESIEIDNNDNMSETLQEENNESNEEIDTLFNNEEVQSIPTVKPQNRIIPILGLIIILAGISYYGYTKFIANNVNENSNIDSTTSTANTAKLPVGTENTTNDAMPVETVENVNLNLSTNEGNAVSIPAIENNLGASITVSNLSIEFVVPAAYKSNKTATRYLSKMGKIIQLNLKAEMLLLTKQPITNRIEVELEYNKNSHNFDVKGILSSSGEKTIDDLILQTIRNALSINLNMNMNVFNNLSGNPILVIKL